MSHLLRGDGPDRVLKLALAVTRVLARERANVDSNGSVWRWHDEAVFLVDHDDIARHQLSTTTRFEYAVDGDIAILNCEFGLTPTADNSDSLEKLIERDRSLV